MAIIVRTTDAAKQQELTVFEIGFNYFIFDSPEKAAQAFALLAKAMHVRKETAINRKSGGPEHFYRRDELIGGLKIKQVPFTALRLGDRALKK